ncbi:MULTISPECIES: hypothetical protein [Rhodococcus]|uniref:hypothetical protein n=1 Tax=Rhodococcus TaxID=1827 RepID=UPI000C79A492|nr:MULTISPECIES: hypothetical protein [Rhodococcus]AUM16438.1 hypothetical protein CSW53_07815 [Rhodococcus ruber]
MPHLFVRGGSALAAMKAQRTTTQNLAAASVYEKIVGLAAVTGTHPETVLVDDEFAANGSGSWMLDVAITHGNTSSGTGVRLLRKPVGGSYSVLQTWSTSGTFHTGVSGSVTVPIERGDLVRVEAMHANGFTRDITSTVLTATLA